ncbi:uncharacterized protein LOC110064953 [Orbicella faveolata]|uniref:uncharacterized protein LOC110064953 n=1 Tax=Orbicella faveolata TaxID=48498 RepID=UPI0009E49108|nr:uncharacterized protein LOC110064953 [Orbicella faveolata]XP_020627718.1 uncharacterized protein LOC110064953 [Orbicella faveolata]
MEQSPLQGTKISLSWLSLNKYFLKLFFLFCGTTLVICAFYLQRTSVVDKGNIQIYDRSLTRHRATNQSSSSVPQTEKEESAWRPGKKIFIAFDYWEQLTMATNSFLDLTALAAYGGRQVVLPFVKDSRFYGVPKKKGFQTLALYYNVSALNHTLRSSGHGTLISWKEFQDVCQGKLDVLVHFDYTNLTKSQKYNRTTRAFFPCNTRHGNTFWGLKAKRTICMNVFAVNSVEKFETDVIEGLPCVGLAQWRGSTRARSYRAQFNLEAVVPHRICVYDAAIFFSARLLQVARDFIAKSLGPFFVSAHVRAEKMLKFGITFSNSVAVKKCISNLTRRVLRYKNASGVPIPLFLATDFGDYGSLSGLAIRARKNAKSLMSILAPLKPIIFQPSTYNLTDHGAVAIVEMNIVSSGKRLFVVGGGSFQKWLVNMFHNKINIDQKAKAGCQIRNCVTEDCVQ